MAMAKRSKARPLVLAVLVSLAAATLFFMMALGVQGETELTRMDGNVQESLHALQRDSPGLTWFFQNFTRLGSWRRLTVLVAVVGLLLLWRRHHWLAAAWFSVIAGGALLEKELKELCQRPRPPYANSLASWSFPSGHMMATVLVCGMVVYLLFVLVRRRSTVWIAAAALAGLTFLVGFSRVYLGQHYLSDVMGALAAAVGWTTAWIAAIETLRRPAGTHSPSCK
jgi:undecaprenyl-diphosphatase